MPALAWNPPGHMVSGSISYQLLQRESSSTVGTVISLLEKHPWFEKHWRVQLNNLPDPDRNEILFMLAPKWVDDIRTLDRAQHHRGPWHYINWPFKPGSEPESVGTRPPQPVNILTALVENERIVRSAVESEKKAIALTWLFHLVGDVHQPLHTIQIFTQEYPVGDRGGNEICVRVRADGKPIELHRFWDRVITSSTNLDRLRNEATALRNRPEFGKGQLTELASNDFAAWAKEGYEIATKITYQNGKLRGTPKG
jgi:S1/P1 Nuclease